MKRVLISIRSISFFFKKHFRSIFAGGILGFFLFFLIIMMVKTISYWLGTIINFQIEFVDVLLSAIGFVLMALIKLLESLRLKEPLS